MKATGETSDVTLERVSETRDQATFSVVLHGNEIGKVAFVKYHEPALSKFDPYLALWAGSTLCVINQQDRTMRCVDRDDETHRVYQYESLWIVEGELNIDLFDPSIGIRLATYAHNEVITRSSLVEGLVRVHDFAGATIVLDPRRALQVVDDSSA